MRLPFDLPDGWPVSLWFFIATAIVYLLQRFPLTGIFLMIVAAAFWSVILINLGFIGVGLEAITGRVSRLWLVLPVAYFGVYYLAYARDQAAAAKLRAEYAAQNAGKTLPFDQDRQDLLIDKGKGDFHPHAFDFVRRFGVERVFDSSGRVFFMGDSEACTLLRGNDVYRSAGVYASGFDPLGPKWPSQKAIGYCSINAPGQPEKPIVRVRSDETVNKPGGLHVRKQRLRISDDVRGLAVELWSGSVATLKAFPMPVMGCGLNSGAASWDCMHGFLRDQSSLLDPGTRYGDTTAAIARVLGLKRSDDYAAIATGPERFRSIAEEADRALIAKEMAKLEAMLANPVEHVRDGWFFHLPNRGEVLTPHAERIVAALAMLQNSDLRGSENGRNLWRLLAAMPEEALAPHRSTIVDWLRPENAKPWTKSEDAIYGRLDVSDPVQRDIVLHRLESEHGDFKFGLVPPFCRMGAAAPAEVKQRLLAIWKARAVDRYGKPRDRSDTELALYVTLARMGLKEAAGKVEQHYYGPTYLAIWEQVTADTPIDVCSGSMHEISNYFRRR